MSRALLSVALLIPVLSSLGCAMCASPYDYCGPTFTGNDCGDPCFVKERAGSILDPAPVAQLASDEGMLQEQTVSDAVQTSPNNYEEDGEDERGIAPEPREDDREPYYEPSPTLRPQPDNGASTKPPARIQHARVAGTFRR